MTQQAPRIHELVSASSQTKIEEKNLRPLIKHIDGQPVYYRIESGDVKQAMAWFGIKDGGRSKEGFFFLQEDPKAIYPPQLFVATFTRKNSKPFENIFIDVECKNTLKDYLLAKAVEGSNNAPWKGKPLAKWKICEFYQDFIPLPPTGVVYRVARLEELPSITKHEPLKPRRHVDDLGEVSTSVYLGLMYAHLANGKQRQPFISWTRDVEIAAWWSLYGMMPVVKTDLATLDPTIRIWDFSNENLRNEVLPGEGYQHQRQFAGRSQEVILDGAVNNYEQVQMQVQSVKVAEFKRNTADINFPVSLAPLKVERTLPGSTQPLLVYHPTNGKTYKYVMKRGMGGGDVEVDKQHWQRFSCGHTSNEFFANLCYHLLGVTVPSCALYSCHVRAEDKVFFTYILLTEFLNGTQPVKDDMKIFTSGVFADILLRNYDVCGEKYCNLLKVGDVGFRIDSGGCLGFGARGKKKKEETADAVLRVMTSPQGADNGARSHLVSLTTDRTRQYPDSQTLRETICNWLLNNQVTPFPEWLDSLDFLCKLSDDLRAKIKEE